MSTRTITYDLTLISGSAAASKVVTFDLLTPLAARSADTVVQISFSSTADENGAGTVTLAVPSSGAYLYNCTLPDGQSFRFSLAAGSATTLHALMAATVGSTVTSADAITTAVDAAITTHNALTTNVHGIADTSDIEPALGNPDADGYVLSSTALGVRSWIQSAADVGDLTTTTGSSTNMLRVAAAGGLEYRTTAQVLGDIGAAPTASPTFTGTVTLPTTVASVIKPASDSTTALQLANAAGAAVLTVDTTNKRVGIGGNPGVVPLSVELATGGAIAQLKSTNAGRSTYLDFINNDGVRGLFGCDGGGFTGATGQFVIATWSAHPLKFFINQTERAQLSTSGYFGVGTTPTAYADLAASTTAAASLRIRSGTAPTSPNDGDIWYDGSNLKIRIGATTYNVDVTAV